MNGVAWVSAMDMAPRGIASANETEPQSTRGARQLR